MPIATEIEGQVPSPSAKPEVSEQASSPSVEVQQPAVIESSEHPESALHALLENLGVFNNPTLAGIVAEMDASKSASDHSEENVQ